MLHKSDNARLVKAMRYIVDIEKIIARHETIKNTLSDVEGEHAVFMCLLQTGEMLNGIHDPELISHLEIPKIVAFRNVIAHEYEGIMRERAIVIVEKNIPELKEKILAILKSEPDFMDLQNLW
jgi:uncharacterized protein with HEPN domain